MDIAMRQMKDQLRREALARRDAMGGEARVEASLAIAERCAAELAFSPGTIIGGFLPIRSEVDPRPLMALLADRGARLAVPAIVGAALEFRELVRGAELVPQKFGTFAPGPDAAVLDPTILLVPLAAFDRERHRIGYGRGFYDCAIAALRGKGIAPMLAGLAYAVQEVERVPAEAHDERLDIIVTETETVRRR